MARMKGIALETAGYAFVFTFVIPIIPLTALYIYNIT